MDTIDTLTKSFDKLFVTTAQNIIGSDIKVFKWTFVFTSVGIGINILLNSYYFTKISEQNKMFKNKLDLILNEQKVVIEGNITIYDCIKNIKHITQPPEEINLLLQINENEIEGYNFL